MVFWDDQQIPGFRTNLFDCRHGRLHGQWQHLWRQIVPPAWVQIGVHWRQLEARIADIDRAVKRWCVLHPLHAKPTFNGWHGVDDALLKLVDGASERGDEMGNHGVSCWVDELNVRAF